MRIRSLACRVRLGHRWETTVDTFGAVTYCVRCGALARGRGRGRSEAFEHLDVVPGGGSISGGRYGSPPSERRG